MPGQEEVSEGRGNPNSYRVRWAFDNLASEKQGYRAKVIEKGNIRVLCTF